MKNALVTGAYGFVGRHVARRLAADGFMVVGIGHGAWGREEWREWGISEWHTSDVSLDKLITYGGVPDIVIHCAGSGSVAFSMTHPVQDYERTVGSTLAVLEFLRLQAPDAKLVIPSSAGVYGLVDCLPIDVNATLNPVSPYGLHKKIAEDLCRSYGKHFGISVALIRLFSVYGPGLRKQLLWDACMKISSGCGEFSGTGEETRDWIHIEDAADLLVRAASAADPSCIVANGASQVEVSVRHVVATIAEEFGGASVSFSGVQRPGDPTRYAGKRQQALELGWCPTRLWEVELKNYINWFKSVAA